MAHRQVSLRAIFSSCHSAREPCVSPLVQFASLGMQGAFFLWQCYIFTLDIFQK